MTAACPQMMRQHDGRAAARSMQAFLRFRPKAALWLAGHHVSSLVTSGKVDEADAETHGMFHGEQQRSNRSKKIVAR